MSSRIPSYRHHKPSGQAVVTIGGHDHYLGKHGTQESREEYDRLISEWLQRGRPRSTANELTIAELVLAYWRFAGTYYVKDGKPTTELDCLRIAFRPLTRLFSKTLANEFGPMRLKAVRDALIEHGLVRTSVNAHIGRIKRMFAWACESELVTPTVYHGLLSVRGLRRGRTPAPETDPIKPVSEEDIQAIREHVSAQVWAMIELQTLTGMRPGEVVIMRAIDIDMTGDIWLYTPEHHKTEHHGHQRVVELGPKAQAVIQPFLFRPVEAPLFSPEEAEAGRSQTRRANRKTKLTPSQRARKRKSDRNRPPRNAYSTGSYCRAIVRACKDAGVPRWTPHRLRHTFATRVRKEYGIETARILLGHATAFTTEIYAEDDRTKAAAVARQIG